VNAAIEAAKKQIISGSSSPSTKKRSHSTCNDNSEAMSVAAQMPPKKQNVFSMMMKVSQTREEWTSPPVDFQGHTEVLEQVLDGKQRQHGDTGTIAWTQSVAQAIVDSLESMVIPKVYGRANFQTKVNALHVLIETATAIAYASKN